MKNNSFTLYRKTRNDIPNDNGFIYTKEAFDNAMEKYRYDKGGLYLAPVALDIDGTYDNATVIKINTEVYAKFHQPIINEDYLIGKVTDWDDYTITFKYTPTNITENMPHMILDDTKVCIRYTPLGDKPKKGIPIGSMRIHALDISVIPFDMIGVDINKLLNNN